MYKKTIFTLLLFLAPIGIIEQHKKDSSPRIINYEYNMIKKNYLHQIDDLFKANEKKNITIKNCLEEDLLSQKQYCSSSKNFT
tara:strand:- start:791 stop:1039 length:249 start_codon:yes stop_codon:yes gene_type:complete